jgi:membrane protein required for colicin V production
MIDLIILGIIAFSILISFWRGFISEVLSFASWVIAFLIAGNFYLYLGSYLAQIDQPTLQQSELLRNGLAALILFIVSLIFCSLIESLIYRLVEFSSLTTVDRILGGAFGALRGVLIVSALLFFADAFTTASQSDLWKESHLISHFDFIVKWFFEQMQNNSSLLKQG